MAVALVGNGTVSVVGVIPVARAWAKITPFRVKFTTGSPKPAFTKPLPVTVERRRRRGQIDRIGRDPAHAGRRRLRAVVP